MNENATGRSRLDPVKDVLLFFKDFERDRFFPNDRYLKKMIRPLYHRLTGKSKVSGFLMWFRLLTQALEKAGYRVHVNQYALAANYPAYPVGLIGYPHLLDGWSLPNPAILGPALFDHPKSAPELMDDPRFRLYLVTCEWMEDMFRPYYGDRCVRWFAGMDTEHWPDMRSHPKDIDVLVYDKIRWDRERQEQQLLSPILNLLKRSGLRSEIVRYQHYNHETYRDRLARSKTMIFLCEHETQGLAYQEALTSNVPILAWENGFWLDPNRPSFEEKPVPATSVPYFSPECGDRFIDFDDFEGKFRNFWDRKDNYQPRQYVLRELTFEKSARLYADYYMSLFQSTDLERASQPTLMP